jgi:hypothetical protein
MSNPSERSTLAHVTEWAAAHQRPLTIGLFAFVGLLVVIAAAMVFGILRDGRGTGGAPSESAMASETASASAAPSLEPSAGTGSPTPQPSDAPSPSPTDGTPPGSLADGWVEVGSFGADDGIEAVHDVVEAPFGLLAAGVHIETRQLPVFGPLPQVGRIWHSVDGRSWEDVTPPGGTFADSSVYQLVALPDGAVVALVQVSPLVEGSPETVYAAWETTDGRTWTGSEISAGFGPVLNVAAGGAGYLTNRPDEPGDMQLWHASDGRTYEPVADPTNGRIVTSMSAGPEGFVILAEVYESAELPKAWASANGIEWFEATRGAWEVGGVAPLGPDWVAVGRGPFDEEWRDTETTTWRSSNGLDWTDAGRIPLRAVSLSDGTLCREFLSDPVSTGSLVVLSTTLSYPCGEGHVQRFGAAHVTADGMTWAPLPFTLESSSGDEGSRGATVHAGLDLGSGTLLVGEEDYRATFWFRPGD